MNEGISPSDLGLVDGLIYSTGMAAITYGVAYGLISIFFWIGDIHRRYKIGKEIEESEEAKGVS